MEMEIEMLVGMWNLSATHNISGRAIASLATHQRRLWSVGLEVDVVERVSDVGGDLEAGLPRCERGEGQVVWVAVEREER
uniref:Uncharacterized protein n=1 Tax=Oryza meridionalis TaxID=40149 RepID=A0A0E0D4I2_9ORYZ